KPPHAESQSRAAGPPLVVEAESHVRLIPFDSIPARKFSIESTLSPRGYAGRPESQRLELDLDQFSDSILAGSFAVQEPGRPQSFCPCWFPQNPCARPNCW